MVRSGRVKKMITDHPKNINVLRNGDVFFKGLAMRVKSSTAWDNFLQNVSDRLTADGAVRRLFTREGVEVLSMEQIEDHGTYIASSKLTAKFQPVDYLSHSNLIFQTAPRAKMHGLSIWDKDTLPPVRAQTQADILPPATKHRMLQQQPQHRQVLILNPRFCNPNSLHNPDFISSFPNKPARPLS